MRFVEGDNQLVEPGAARVSCQDAEVVWGSVADWVGSIGTAGSLILGFVILLRDRLKNERSQAERVIVWSRFKDDRQLISVRNASDKPIFAVTLASRPVMDRIYTDTRSTEALEASRAQVPPMIFYFELMEDASGDLFDLDPGTAHVIEMPHFVYQYVQECLVTFQDAAGESWGYVNDDPRQFRLVKARELRRLSRRISDQLREFQEKDQIEM